MHFIAVGESFSFPLSLSLKRHIALWKMEFKTRTTLMTLLIAICAFNRAHRSTDLLAQHSNRAAFWGGKVGCVRTETHTCATFSRIN